MGASEEASVRASADSASLSSAAISAGSDRRIRWGRKKSSMTRIPRGGESRALLGSLFTRNCLVCLIHGPTFLQWFSLSAFLLRLANRVSPVPFCPLLFAIQSPTAVALSGLALSRKVTDSLVPNQRKRENKWGQRWPNGDNKVKEQMRLLGVAGGGQTKTANDARRGTEGLRGPPKGRRVGVLLSPRPRCRRRRRRRRRRRSPS